MPFFLFLLFRGKMQVNYLIGADEAGRGCAIGDLGVCAVGVVVEAEAEATRDLLSRVRDSKQIKQEEVRFELADEIQLLATQLPTEVWVSFREISSATIDTDGNINKTVNRGWCECIREILLQIETQDPAALDEGRIRVIIDGNSFRMPEEWKEDTILRRAVITNVIKADALCPCVSAASIVAKCIHDDSIDRIVRSTQLQDPELHRRLVEVYQLPSNKGYLSKAHLAAIKEYGPTVFHRMTFEPCKSFSLTPLIT